MLLFSTLVHPFTYLQARFGSPAYSKRQTCCHASVCFSRNCLVKAQRTLCFYHIFTFSQGELCQYSHRLLPHAFLHWCSCICRLFSCNICPHLNALSFSIKMAENTLFHISSETPPFLLQKRDTGGVPPWRTPSLAFAATEAGPIISGSYCSQSQRQEKAQGELCQYSQCYVRAPTTTRLLSGLESCPACSVVEKQVRDSSLIAALSPWTLKLLICNTKYVLQ